ncbi:MAG: B12-binding domain-containing radical SAM protein [Nitrospirae bacterium]|nr:B12-binding domain-containing radical SAM protein [Nitrospirota bacterium]
MLANARVLLVNPPHFDMAALDTAILHSNGYFVYPPMGLLYLAASIEDMDIRADIIDLNYETLKWAKKTKNYSADLWKEILRNKIDGFSPSLVGVTCMFSNERNLFEPVLDFLMKMERFAIIAGGPHVSFEYKDLLDAGLCHFALTKECEHKFPYLLDRLFSLKASKPPVSGIYYKDRGEIRETSGCEGPPNFDIDITNAYRLLEIEQYCRAGSLNQYSRYIGQEESFTTLQMNRGCRGHCAFCTVHTLMGSGIRGRSVGTLINEIRYLRNERGVTVFDWVDDDLLSNRKGLLSLFAALKREGLEIKWHSNNGVMASSLSEDLLASMVESGCAGFKIGIESGNPEIRKKIRKPSSMDKLLEVSESLNKFPELFVAGNYIIGFPDETFKQMLDTFAFANKINLDWSGFYICQPLKGTDIYSGFEELGLTKQTNYIPVRNQGDNLPGNVQDIYRGMDIFKISHDSTISQHQLQEVWFTFSIITNFINNKNLYKKELVHKFTKWVSGAINAYPSDAGMAFFLYLGFALQGDFTASSKYYKLTRALYEGSAYWQSRFGQFAFLPGLQRQCNTVEESYDVLVNIRQHTSCRQRHIVQRDEN